MLSMSYILHTESLALSMYVCMCVWMSMFTYGFITTNKRIEELLAQSQFNTTDGKEELTSIQMCTNRQDKPNDRDNTINSIARKEFV